MSLSDFGNQFAYNLTPQQRQAIGAALLSQAGQPIQNTGGPVSPLSILAKALQSDGGMKKPQPTQAPLEQQAGQPLSGLQSQSGLETHFNPMNPQDSQALALDDGAAPSDALWNGDDAALGKAMADNALTS